MSNETMTAALVPAMASQETQQPAGMTYVSDIIGEAYKGWENGRVIFDCGTGRGKNEFIIRKLADYAIDRMSEGDTNHKILYLCPLNALYEGFCFLFRAKIILVQNQGRVLIVANHLDHIFMLRHRRVS